MKTAIRYDSFKIDKSEMTSHGFLKVPALVARTGIQTYRKADGSIIRELRPPLEVFSKDSMDSFKGAPITDNHPGIIVTSGNSKELMVGHTGESVRVVDGKFIGLDALITDENTIQKVRDGKQELSAGYRVHLDFTPGEFEGEKYDAVQRDIRINHVAIVDRGRAGREVKLRLDSDDAIVITQDDKTGKTPSPKENAMKMVKITVDGTEFEVPEAVATQMQADAATRDQLKQDNDKFKEKSKSDADEKAKLQAQVDANSTTPPKKNEETSKADADKENRAQIRQRTKIERTAQLILGKKFDEHQDNDDHELRIAVIEHDLGEGNTLSDDQRSEAYVTARFDILAKQYQKSQSTNEKVGQLFDSNENDRDDGDDQENGFEGQEAKSDQQLQDYQANWNKPVGYTKQTLSKTN